MNLNVIIVFTDVNSGSIIDFCRERLINCYIGNPRLEKAKLFIANISIDYILSVNYLFLIDKYLIRFPLKGAINFHGSLLPKYRGRTPHIWAIINNEKFTGITAHLITEECDAGDIILQKEIPIKENMTGAELLYKYRDEYPLMIQELLNIINENNFTFIKQNSIYATYYGKRTPEDGLINWDWQKERIYNWVRALTYPYPGAFSFYDGQKIIVDGLYFSNLGYDYRQKNGTILQVKEVNELVVKTENGAVGLILRNEKRELKAIFKIGNLLQ